MKGWRVLELGDTVAVAFCAKVLCDLGADVVKVEPAEGCRSRGSGPRRLGSPAGEPSGRFSYLNTGKRSVGVDDQSERRVVRLISEADVLLTDGALGLWMCGGSCQPR